MTDFRNNTSFEASLRAALEAFSDRLCGQTETDIQDLVAGLTAGARRRRQAAADVRLAVEARLSEAFAQSLAVARSEEDQAALAGVARLLTAIRAFDSCSSLSQLLDVLVVCAAREAGRAVFLTVRHQRLRGWRAAGFGPQARDIHLLELPLVEANVIGQAVQSRQPVATGPNAPAPPFTILGTERAGLAIPLEVGGEVVGVLYADTMGEAPGAAPAAWPEFLEVLSRHAGRCLEVLTATRLAGQPSPRHSRSGTGSANARTHAVRQPASRAIVAQNRAARAD